MLLALILIQLAGAITDFNQSKSGWALQLTLAQLFGMLSSSRDVS